MRGGGERVGQENGGSEWVVNHSQITATETLREQYLSRIMCVGVIDIIRRCHKVFCYFCFADFVQLDS